jgi:ABC-type transport system substrate-binding protein
VPAQFILPPGIFGYSDQVNPYVYDLVDGKLKRKSIDEAKQLLAQAGYPEGRDAKTGDPLIIHFDTTSGAGPQSQARDAWMRKQFKKLGIDLDVRSTDYNRFRDKLDNGTFQLFMYGWIGDYPDPENFLFLLYGPNGKRHHDGVNSTNYQNDQFDALYQRMVVLPDGDEKQTLINQMRDLAIKDSPMVWGLNPEGYSLKHDWLDKVIPNPMVRNALKYYEIDGKERSEKRLAWNKPKLWPIPLCITVIVIIILPVYLGYRRKEHRNTAKRFKK